MDPYKDSEQGLTPENRVDQVLGEAGLFASQLPRFRPREQQLELAAGILRSLDASEDLLAEAGTGIGKTFAYLVAVILTGRKAIISTGTKTLQDQLFERDIPEVLNIMDVSMRVRLLKGRSNYLCLYRYHKTRFSAVAKTAENKPLFTEMDVWINNTERGELSELSLLPGNNSLYFNVTSTPENCLGMDCDHYTECFVYKARRKAMNADLLVVNHHLLFADMALKSGGFGEVLPEVDVVVMDESHQIPEIAGRFFSQTFSSRQCQELLRDLAEEASAESGATAAIADQVQWLERALRDCFMHLHDVPGKGNMQQLRQQPRVYEILELLQSSLQDLEQAAAVIAIQSSGLESCHGRIRALLALLDDMLRAEDSDAIYWYETRSKYFSLNKSPLDIATPLSAFRAGLDMSWVLTSATLTVNREFKHYQQQTGFDTAQTLLLDSPFDYQQQALLLLPQGLPEPNDYAFNQAMFDYMLPLIESVSGGVFFLFTSHRSLQQAAEYFSNRLQRPLFIQGTQERNQMLREFRKSGRGVLLGAASFWEGVDVAGENLSCVIIDRLPFAHPDDPILQARINHIKDNGGNPFFDYQIPRAAISLKQGAGRLIRGESDRGLLVIADPRMISKGYGRVFRNSLPPMPVTQSVDEAMAFISDNC